MNTVFSLVSARRLAGAALAGSLLMVAAGCARNSIVGKWQGNIPLAGQNQPATMEFKPDGTETLTASAQTPIGPVSVVAIGTYVVKDASLQMTQTSMTVNGRAMSTRPQTAKSQTVPFKLDGDTLTLTPPTATQAVTLTRVKQ